MGRLKERLLTETEAMPPAEPLVEAEGRGEWVAEAQDSTRDVPGGQESKQLPVAAGSASPLDLPTDVFEAGLQRRKQNRAVILDWIRTALVESADYGRIHTAGKERCPFVQHGQVSLCSTPSHWSKPSLFKPGAEKICGMLGVTVHYPNMMAYEQAALSGQPLTVIVLRCELHDAQGRTVAEGIGARSLQQDNGDLNKALKMASKSAHIDATLRMAGLSEVFTQDLEDLPLAVAHAKAQTAQGKAGKSPLGGDSGEQVSSSEELPEGDAAANYQPVNLAPSQLNHLEERIKELGLDRERVLRWVKTASKGKITAFEEMTPVIYERVILKLEDWAKPSGKADGSRRDEAA